MADIKVADDIMSQIASKALYEAINAETRERLLTNALKHIITPNESDRYGVKFPSPLQQAFNDQMTRACNVIVEEYLKRPEVVSQIHEIIEKSVTEMMAVSKEKNPRCYRQSDESCNRQFAVQRRMIAALFVQTNGVYFGHADIDPRLGKVAASKTPEAFRKILIGIAMSVDR